MPHSFPEPGLPIVFLDVLRQELKRKGKELITKTLSTSEPPSSLVPGKQGGPFSSIDLTFPCHTPLFLKTLSLMLSSPFDLDSSCRPPNNILPSPCVVGTLTLGIEERVRPAKVNNPLWTFAPKPVFCSCLWFQVIHWAHISLFSCHPGIGQTIFIIIQHFVRRRSK